MLCAASRESLRGVVSAPSAGGAGCPGGKVSPATSERCMAYPLLGFGREDRWFSPVRGAVSAPVGRARRGKRSPNAAEETHATRTVAAGVRPGSLRTSSGITAEVSPASGWTRSYWEPNVVRELSQAFRGDGPVKLGGGPLGPVYPNFDHERSFLSPSARRYRAVVGIRGVCGHIPGADVICRQESDCPV